MSKQCQMCGAGELHEDWDYLEYEYKGVEGLVPCYHYECDRCGAHLVDVELQMKNISYIRQYQEAVDQL